MLKPCAVFCDLLNSQPPEGLSAKSIIDQIRSTVIRSENLNEIYFYCVCDFRVLPDHLVTTLTNLGVQIVHADNERDSIDEMVTGLMRKFVENAPKDCAIMLLSGEGDYSETLAEISSSNSVTVYLIKLTKFFSEKFKWIPYSGYTFINGQIRATESVFLAPVFIKLNNTYVCTNYIKSLMTDGQDEQDDDEMTPESFDKSAIIFDDFICIEFPSLSSAENSIRSLENRYYYGLEAQIIPESPLLEILKGLNTDETIVQTTGNEEMKQLTFIQINNSGSIACDEKLLDFCLACSIPCGAQCILSKKPSIWIVFAYASHAEIFLSKVKILYKDAKISDPPEGLLAYCSHSPNLTWSNNRFRISNSSVTK